MTDYEYNEYQEVMSQALQTTNELLDFFELQEKASGKNECICVDCPNKCYEYENNSTSDKAYYEWTYKEDKCKTEAS